MKKCMTVLAIQRVQVRNSLAGGIVHTSSSSSPDAELTVCRDLATNQLKDAFAAKQNMKVEQLQPRRWTTCELLPIANP